jgi:transcriptional regulator with XRE-family HTH domain
VFYKIEQNIGIDWFMTETFGKKLRDLRIQFEIGLREPARLINNSPGYLSDVEHGHVPPPSEDVILKIAAALNLVNGIMPGLRPAAIRRGCRRYMHTTPEGLWPKRDAARVDRL